MGFLWVRCFGVGVIAIFLKVSSEYFFLPLPGILAVITN